MVLQLTAPAVTVPDERVELASITLAQAGGDTNYTVKVLDSKDAELKVLTYSRSQYSAGTALTEALTLKDKAYRFVIKGTAVDTVNPCPTFDAMLAP